MSMTAQLLEQRAVGQVKLVMGQRGPERIREQGSSKFRMPPASREAILINTAGGLAGGDHFSTEVVVRAGASLTVTTQAAERVYRTLGPAARVEARLTVEEGAQLLWLPHETILFNEASLHRSLTIDVAQGASFIGLEWSVYGRTAMAEHISHLSHREDWRVKQGDKLIHAEAWRLEGAPPSTRATFDGHCIATLIIIAPNAERHLDVLREMLGDDGSASAWNGKLVARLSAKDGFTARKRLVSALSAVVGVQALPKVWTM